MPTKKKITTKSYKKNSGTQAASVSLWQRLRNSGLKENVLEAFRAEYGHFIVGFLILCASLFLILSFASNIFTGKFDQAAVQNGVLLQAHNWLGTLGAYVSNYFMDTCFGMTSLFIPLFTLLIGIKLMGTYRVRLWKWFLNFSILMIWGSVFLSLLTDFLPSSFTTWFSFRLGGGHGDVIKIYLTHTLGHIGAWIAVIAIAVFYLLYLTRETIDVIHRIMHPQDYIRAKIKHKGNPNEERQSPPPSSLDDETHSEEKDVDIAPHDSASEASTGLDNYLTRGSREETIYGVSNNPELGITPTITEDKAKGKTVEKVLSMEPYDPRKDLEYYKYPVISLLKRYENSTPSINEEEQNANKNRIITVLRSFGVEIASIRATIGPTITLYEVVPAPGVRISKIRNLEDDIALSLSAKGIRIIAPIPGKGTIGIEVPNMNPRIVSMESIINTKKFQESTFELPIALGKTITNETFMVDLAKMPHLLVAGATGQGKSVGLNAIITSLLYKKHPAELKFVMIDPKKVEFSIYTPIESHFLAKIPDEDDPIITDVSKVVQTLKSLCQLMDHRYDLLRRAGVRTIKEYNAKFKARQLNPNNGHEFMPYIVVIIDEFGDLIMTAGKEVELPIARIAQLARAVGIHMVIATQRPTTNIITGTIKANFPARMAFKVMSQIDSRTILDQGGANQLVGMGDMLFLSGGMPVRVQCAFVDTPEVERISEYIADQQGYLSAYELPEPEMNGEDGSGGKSDIDSTSLDPMFEEAARLIVVHQQGSTSLIQRKLAIGYNRAGRLMDQLERAGIVGPVRGSKPREVLVQDEIELDSKISTLHDA